MNLYNAWCQWITTLPTHAAWPQLPIEWTAPLRCDLCDCEIDRNGRDDLEARHLHNQGIRHRNILTMRALVGASRKRRALGADPSVEHAEMIDLNAAVMRFWRK